MGEWPSRTFYRLWAFSSGKLFESWNTLFAASRELALDWNCWLVSHSSSNHIQSGICKLLSGFSVRRTERTYCKQRLWQVSHLLGCLIPVEWFLGPSYQALNYNLLVRRTNLCGNCCQVSHLLGWHIPTMSSDHDVPMHAFSLKRFRRQLDDEVDARYTACVFSTCLAQPFRFGLLHSE